MTPKHLRIWHVCETYPPDYGGGAAITTRDVCRVLADRGHEVRVLCAESSAEPGYTIRTEWDGAIRIDRVNLPYFKKTDPEGWQLGLWQWRKHECRVSALFRSCLREWPPDVIDYHSARPFGEQGVMTLAEAGVPLVATLHDAWLLCLRVMLLQSPASTPCDGPAPMRCFACMHSHYDGNSWRAALKMPWRILRWRGYMIYRLWRRSCARRKTLAAIARSEFLARSHRRYLDGHIQHIPLGIDLAGLPRERPSRPRTPMRFGFIGGDQPNKGIDQVLTAVAGLRKAGHDFRLHIWGPGCDRLEAEIARRALTDCVHLHGTYTHTQVWDVYREMDVALMATTVSEPFGRVVQEAAAIGTPTIAPDVGGITEQIRHGVDGLLYRFRDAGDLERQMRRILTEPPLYARLVGNLPSVGDTRDLAVGVEQFYFQILGLAGKGESPSPSMRGCRVC